MLMWVSWKDSDGNSAAARELRWGQFEANMDLLKSTLRLGAVSQHSVTRRLFAPDGTLTTRTFQGEVANSIPFSHEENDWWPSAKLSVDWLCADPYWYGPQVTINATPPQNQTHNNVGTMEAMRMIILLSGPLTNPIITNKAYLPDISLRVNKVLGAGDVLTLDTENFTATDQNMNNVISSVVRANAREWMKFVPGNNPLVFGSDSGADTGTFQIVYQPAYV
jgi:hypothetical protein